MFICPLDINKKFFIMAWLPKQSDVIGVDAPTVYDDMTFSQTSFDLSNPPIEEDDFNPLPEMIRNSSIYKDAYNIFSSDKSYGGPFLEQLFMIPESFAIRDKNFWDSFTEFFGGTSGYENAVSDAFNNAMDEIRILVQNYQTFKNGLPAEQVQQLQEAGINAAITGEGVSPSSMPESFGAALSQPNQSQSAYSNEQLSLGVSSFVEFLGSMSTLLGTGFNASSLMGMLDIAERESYNKQETHDLLLSQMGVVTDSPYRVLTPSNSPVLSSNAEGAAAASSVVSAHNVANKKALESPIRIGVGDDPNESQRYEVRSGMDWMVEASRYKIANQFSQFMINQLRNDASTTQAGLVAALENNYKAQNFSAMAREAQFNFDFFNFRDGATEGENQTSLSTSIASLRQSEANIKAVENWMSDYRAEILEHWGEQLKKRPSLAPYFYKALFDFGMEDTFYHQSGPAQALKYGMKSLNSIGSFLGNLTGFTKPKLQRKSGQTTVTNGPHGQTVTETINHYE